ncbi:efflux RND transporter periplasmic adaptor subunit [Mesorhizobium opportunistum]|uniref:Efflux RND transporter periplasmic adaptor subunit n=1 Tax=Mesorhizobium opportunistum TaxID=593909 RepID=A0ABV1YJ05_9HYPH|nr:efflux RND transporter periplasmic adaptor subunit [Mesorhizobium sp.]TIN97417.1 MAG: efflux RND transporter periplasmic adaptor subunit [Mesorhizobium sp.]TJU98679.1 MAG: efflux RND transporter periplasmic adaptor subunit [Mesorhizobium sp.]TJV19197.1 MAG: efflux RND transporter periplasmic adaptor subunit [Mesorhizobium sp.]
MRMLLLFAALQAASPALAGTLTLAPTTVTEWKAVYGGVEARDTVPARARVGGLVVDLAITEGEPVKAGQKIATVQDDKIAFQVAALDAQLRALQAQLETAQSELTRGQTLVDKGVMTAQRLDQLRTDVDVARNQLAATEAQRSVIIQQAAEGDVFAPGDGRVLTVPVTRGAVVMAGEVVATIGGGGVFLRLAVPERYATTLKQGAAIRINASGKESAGRLAKIYPQIENGRVIADVEVDNLDTDFIGARVLVELPVAERSALLVPTSAVATRSGIDFVRVIAAGVETERAVVPGERMTRADGDYVEILTGLAPGDVVITP